MGKETRGTYSQPHKDIIDGDTIVYNIITKDSEGEIVSVWVPRTYHANTELDAAELTAARNSIGITDGD